MTRNLVDNIILMLLLFTWLCDRYLFLLYFVFHVIHVTAPYKLWHYYYSFICSAIIDVCDNKPSVQVDGSNLEGKKNET